MALTEARMKFYNPLADGDVINAQLAESEIIFVRDGDGNLVEGCGYGIEKRIDDDHIQLWVCTDESIVTAYLTDPRIELLEMKLTCSQCGKEWWGLPTKSGLCAECEQPSEPKIVEAEQMMDLPGKPEIG